MTVVIGMPNVWVAERKEVSELVGSGLEEVGAVLTRGQG